MFLKGYNQDAAAVGRLLQSQSLNTASWGKKCQLTPEVRDCGDQASVMLWVLSFTVVGGVEDPSCERGVSRGWGLGCELEEVLAVSC